MVEIPDDVAKREAARLRGQDVLTLADSRLADILDPQPPRPQVGEHIRIIAEGVVTAYDPGSDAVQLDHEECWWPYSDAGSSVRYETRDPQPEPSSPRERVAEVVRAHFGFTSDSLSNYYPCADAVLAVVADFPIEWVLATFGPRLGDWLAAQPLWSDYHASADRQRAHDVRLIWPGGTS